jgi:hypothetical protein
METGFETVVTTEEDPDRTRIEVEAPSDMYLVFLEPGYYLEKVGSDLEPALEAIRASKELVPGLRARLVGAGGAVGLPELPEPPGTAGSIGAGGAEGVPELPEPPGAAGAPPDLGAAGSGGDSVDAQLISDNPAFVFVAPFETSLVVFRFRVGDEVIVTDPGTLAIEIEVEEGSSCEDDNFEPNDTMDQAASVASDASFEAVACEADDDWYIFDAPASEGERFGVIVSFVHADGDIDALLIDADGFIVSFGGGVTDDEILGTVSDGRSYYLLVYTYDTANTYSVQITSDVEELTSDCCSESPFPGCADDAVSECVCAMYPFCCEVAFDMFCVMVAMTECGAECLGPGSCCETTLEPGCNDPEVNACVCATDYRCCLQSYDELCITQAQAECGLVCGMPPAENDCCSAAPNPGCTDPATQDCVCKLDPMCCLGPYDENCVNLAASECGADCAAPPPSGSCCEPSVSPGCTDSEVEACVCTDDPFCCEKEFDAVCVDVAQSQCGAICEEESP